MSTLGACLKNSPCDEHSLPCTCTHLKQSIHVVHGIHWIQRFIPGDSSKINKNFLAINKTALCQILTMQIEIEYLDKFDMILVKFD